MIYEKYSPTNFHEMNLDWILREIQLIKKEIAALPAMDEKIKELEEMLRDLDLALAHALGMGLVDNSNYNLYAQVLPDNNSRFNGQMYAQGFCIGDDGGRPVVAQMFIDDPNGLNPHTLFTLTHMDDGSKYVEYVDTLEHGNSLTYVPQLDHYICATAGDPGDQGALVEIGKDGHRIYTHYMPEPCWAVANNGDCIYAMGGTNLYTLDMNFNILSVVDLPLENGVFTYQGMTADDLYIYLFNGNTIPTGTAEKNINRCSVFSHDGLPVKQVYMNFPLEIEEGDFLDGQLYISSNTTHCALICKADMYTKNRNCSFGETYDNIDFNQNAIEIHVDETYKGFLVDGSNDHPLSAITWLITWLRNSTDRMNIKIDSDITQVPTLSFRRCPNAIFDIDGGGNKLPNLLFDGGTLYLNNALLPGIQAAMTIQFFGKRLVLNNVTFGESGSAVVPSRLIFTTSSYEINTIRVNQDAEWFIYALGCGYISGASTFNNPTPTHKFFFYSGPCGWQSVPFEKLKNGTNRNQMNNCILNATSYNHTFSINDISIDIIISRSGGSVTDMPTGVSWSQVNVLIAKCLRPYGTNSMLYTFYLNDGTIVQEMRTPN